MAGFYKKSVYLNNCIEESIYYSGRRGKNIKNSPARGKTPLNQLHYQDRKAERLLYWKLEQNFKRFTDLFITLTYKAGSKVSSEQARGDIDKFLARIRLEYKKQGKTFKYIGVAGRSKRGNVHFHMVINSINIEIVARVWRKITGANINVKVLYGSFKQLANYLIKNSRETFYSDDRIYQKRFCTSQNLTMPVIKTRAIKSIKWNAEPRPPKGYILDKASVYNGYGYFDAGGCYASTRIQRYTFIKIDTERKHKYRLNAVDYHKLNIPVVMPEWDDEEANASR